jgi:hypothetical protein
MKVSRKFSMTVASALAVLGLVAGTAAPAMAANRFPAKACYANGTGSPSTGTVQGQLLSTQVNSNETYYGGQCGAVEVKAFFTVPGGTVYEAGWVSNSTSAWSAVYYATVKGYHDSTTSSPYFQSWW